ncbi:hypothetical protein BLS_000142 [Venturia inaequalis]|uniref:Small ribosomal subunit protein mS29 n=1 Tax=Venturia inaequalis TaxID=5025 RepID=A0A8H3Z348_VENIN|nr:hypothetical protein BLS_000142 [Venturia inaequalis]
MPPRPSRHLCSLSLRANDTSAIKNPQWFQSHSFSTSTPKALPAPAKKKTSTSGPPKKGVTILRIKKKGVQQSTAKPPAPGERKALRKRIVLSNTNALEVPGLQEMGIGTLSNEASIGAVMALPGDVVDRRELTVGHTAYAPIPNTTPLQYSQSTYTANLLSQFLKANKKLLSTLKLTSKPDFNFPLAQGTTLATLAEAGTNDEDRAWPVFQHIWRELQVPGRPPVLYCIDNISHIMGDSKYTTLDAADKLRPIHAHDFVQVKHFIDHLSGERELVNGGMVLAATSLSEHIKSAALDTVIKAAEARQENEGETRVSDHYDPYQKLDMRALKALTSDFESLGPPSGANAVPDAPATPEAIDTTATSEPTPEEATSVVASTVANELGVIRLKGITKAEAKTILEYWATSGMVRRQIEEKFVADQWTVAGGGVFKELERGCLRRTV